MSVFQRMTFEFEARRLITRARKINRATAKARGEHISRSALFWTVYGLAVIASNAAQLAILLHFGAF